MSTRVCEPKSGWVWYFAYGSNMNAHRLFDERLAADGVPWGRRVAARLDGWRLCFDAAWHRFPGAGVANIRRDASAHVWGTLNEMAPDGLVTLDRYEGVAARHYARGDVTVTLASGEIARAVTYAAVADPVEGLKPAREYLDHLLAGADVLPADYTAALRRTAFLDGIAERPLTPIPT